MKNLINPKISIIIPVYNVEEFLMDCIDSVRCQRYDNLEIICIDDASKDSSLKILKQAAKEDKRIVIIENRRNIGLAATRNVGLKAAKGDYILFLDSDDYLAGESIIEDLKDKALLSDADVILTGTRAFPNDGCQNMKYIDGLNHWLNRIPVEDFTVNLENFSKIIDSVPCVAWGRLYSRKFLIENEIYFIERNVIHEDNGFFLKLCVNTPRVVTLTQTGVMYRIRNGSITNNLNKKTSYMGMKAILDDVFCFLEKKGALRNFFKRKIKNSYTYGLYLERNPYILSFKWERFHKELSLFGFRIFRSRGGSAKAGLDSRDTLIYDILSSFGKFYFMPNEGNFGDALIAFAEYQRFRKWGVKYEILSSNHLKKNTDINLVYGGGGLFCGLYDYSHVKEIFQSKAVRNVLILPSSFINCDDILSIFDSRFIVFCRDEKSYNYCKSRNRNAHFFLHDDMAIGCDLTELRRASRFESFYPDILEIRKNIKRVVKKNQKRLYAFRTDKEKGFNCTMEEAFDLSNFYPYGFFTKRYHTKLLAALFVQTIDLFDEVYTDRLHVGIASALLGKKTVLFDNSYGKLSSVYDFSLRNFDNVRMACFDNLNEHYLNNDKK